MTLVNPFREQASDSGELVNPFKETTAQTPAAPRPKLTRSWGEAIGDTAKAVGAGVGGLTQTAGDAYGLVTGDFDNAVSRTGADMRRFYQDSQSAALQEKRADRSAAIDASDSVVGKAGTAIKETLTDPALLVDTLAENVPMLVPGAAAGRVASAATKSRALLRGATAGQAALRGARVGTGVAIGTGALQQGTDVAGGVYRDALATDDSALASNPEYQKRIAAGEDPAAVRQDLALTAARLAFPGAAALSAASQAIPGGAAIERALVGGAARSVLTRPGIPGRIIGAARGAFGEATQEAVEEGGGQFIGNVAQRAYGDPNADLTEGVGENAGIGFAAGFGLGGVAGAASRQAETMPGTLTDVARTVAPPAAAQDPARPMLALPSPTMIANPAGDVAPESRVFTARQQREQRNVDESTQLSTDRAELGLTSDVNAARRQHPAAIPNAPILKFPMASPGSLADAANVMPDQPLLPLADGAAPTETAEKRKPASGGSRASRFAEIERALGAIEREFGAPSVPAQPEASAAPDAATGADQAAPAPANLDPETGELLGADAEVWPNAAEHQQPAAIVRALAQAAMAKKGSQRPAAIKQIQSTYNVDEPTARALRARAVREITDSALRDVRAADAARVAAESAPGAPVEDGAVLPPADAEPAAPAAGDSGQAARGAVADEGEAGASASPPVVERAEDTPADTEQPAKDVATGATDTSEAASGLATARSTNGQQKPPAVQHMGEHAAAVQQPDESGVEELRGQRDQGLLGVGSELPELRDRRGATAVGGHDAGSEGQQQGVSARERALGNTDTAGEQHQGESSADRVRRNEDLGAVGAAPEVAGGRVASEAQERSAAGAGADVAREPGPALEQEGERQAYAGRGDAVGLQVGQAKRNGQGHAEEALGLGNESASSAQQAGATKEGTIAAAATAGTVQAAAAEAATSPTNDIPDATPAQRDAGNFKVGRMKVAGLDVSIEYPSGVKRKPDHKPLTRAYGYFRGTVGRDKDHVDVFLGDRADDPALPVFVIDQVDAQGKYDEAKVVLGEADEAGARAAYLSNYPKGWTGLGGITQMTQEQFKEWVRDPAKTKRRLTRTPRPSVTKTEEQTTPRAAPRDGTPSLPSIVRKTDAMRAMRTHGGMTVKQAEAVWQNLPTNGLKTDRRAREQVLSAIETARAAATAPATSAPLKAAPERNNEETEEFFVANDVRLFSKPAARASAPTRLSFDRALQLKRELTAQWGENAPTVIVVQDAEGFPDDAKVDPYYRRGEGFYNGKPTVWINAGAIATERRFAEVLAHEALGHFGVERILGTEAWDGIVDAIARHERAGTGAASLRRAIADVRRRYGQIGRTDFAKEVVAVMAEQGARNGIINRIVAAVRRWLRANMPSLAREWTDADIVGLLAQADSFLHAGRTNAEARAAVAKMAFSRGDTVREMRSLGIPAEAGEPAFVFRTDAELKAHPAYRRAKEGDRAAAVELVLALGPRLAESMTAYGPDVIFVAPHAVEASGENTIPQMLATYLAIRNNARDDVEIVQQNKVYHTGADAMQRLIAPSQFDGPVIQGGRYVLVDDVTTLGGTLADLAGYIRQGGGEVVGTAVLVNAARSGRMHPEPRVLRELERRHGDEIRSTLRIDPTALTAEEAQYLLGFRTADELRGRAASAKQARTERLRSKGIRLENGITDSPAPPSAGPGRSGGSFSQADPVNTPAFKNWFRRSKVVTPANKPKVVYHGTASEFWAFDPERLRGTTGHMTAPLGFFFAENRANAERYAVNAAEGVPADERVLDVYLSIQRPKRMTLEEFLTVDDFDQAIALRRKLVKDGFDGIHLTDNGQWVAFEPAQIKSASENRGTFDAAASDIRFSRPDPVPGLFSRPAEDVLADIDAVMTAGNDASLLERARATLRDLVPAKVKDQLRPAWLGALTTRHLTELGADYFDNIKHYSAFLAEQGADRNKLQAEGEAIVESARKWAGKNRTEAAALFDLMHQSTIDGVDPSVEFKPLQFRYGGQLHEATPKNVKDGLKAIREQMLGRSADNKKDMMAEAKVLRGMPARNRRRREHYGPLVERWNRLSPEAQQIYRQFRDTYEDRSKQVEEGLVARINDTDAPDNHKRKLINTIRQQFETQRLQGVYFPLQRHGRFFVAAEKGDSNAFLMFESLNQLERAVRDLKGRGFTITAQGLKSAGKAKDAPSGTFVAEVIETMRKAGVSDKTQDEIYQIYLEALPEMSMRKHAIHRKAVPGFDPDAIRAFAFNMHHGAHQLARLRHGHKMQNVLDLLKKTQDAARKEAGADTRKIVAGDAILGELDRRHEWINNPQDSQATNLVSSFGFGWYLAASPAAALVNLSQTALVTYPYLASRFGAVKAMNHLLSASRDSIRTVGHIQRTLTDPDEQRAHNVLQAMGALDKTQAHNLAGIAEGGLTGYNPAWAKAMEIIGWGFHKTEVVNREATGLAAFRLARAAGETFDKAVQTAAAAINDTHFDYTNANRARFMQSGTAKVLLMFRQYSLNMTWHLGRMVWQATNGQTPEVKKLARRNLAGLLGMSALFSGAMGLPMMSATMGVLNALAASFGDDDEPWEAETEFRAFLRDMLGEEAAETLLGGLVNQVTGADIASRVGMSQLWIRDADRELDGRGAYYHLLEQAAGPMGGVLKNVLVGKQLMDEGHTMRGVETMLPKGLKDVVKAGRYATQGVNNLRGDAMVEDPSLYEALLQLNGFTPAQVARQYDENRSLKGYESQILGRRQHLMDAYAMAWRLGDAEGMSAAREKISAFNQANREIGITSKSLAASIRTRARYSARAEGGIVLNKRLERRVREEVGAD